MSNRSRGSRIARLVDFVGSVIVVSAAVEGGRRPIDRDLQALGIDPRQFNKIRHL